MVGSYRSREKRSRLKRRLLAIYLAIFLAVTIGGIAIQVFDDVLTDYLSYKGKRILDNIWLFPDMRIHLAALPGFHRASFFVLYLLWWALLSLIIMYFVCTVLYLFRGRRDTG